MKLPALLSLLLLLSQNEVQAAFTTPSYKTSTPTTKLNAMSFLPKQDEKLSVVKTSSLPGNFNFDPLHLAHSKEQLIVYRQAEMKHGRLAMLVRW